MTRHATKVLVDAISAVCPDIELTVDELGFVSLLCDDEIGVTAAPFDAGTQVCLVCRPLEVSGGTRPGQDDKRSNAGRDGWIEVTDIEGDFSWSTACQQGTGAVVLTATAPASRLDAVACREWLEAFVDWAKSTSRSLSVADFETLQLANELDFRGIA